MTEKRIRTLKRKQSADRFEGNKKDEDCDKRASTRSRLGKPSKCKQAEIKPVRVAGKKKKVEKSIEPTDQSEVDANEKDDDFYSLKYGKISKHNDKKKKRKECAKVD